MNINTVIVVNGIFIGDVLFTAFAATPVRPIVVAFFLSIIMCMFNDDDGAVAGAELPLLMSLCHNCKWETPSHLFRHLLRRRRLLSGRTVGLSNFSAAVPDYSTHCTTVTLTSNSSSSSSATRRSTIRRIVFLLAAFSFLVVLVFAAVRGTAAAAADNAVLTCLK